MSRIASYRFPRRTPIVLMKRPFFCKPQHLNLKVPFPRLWRIASFKDLYENKRYKISLNNLSTKFSSLLLKYNLKGDFWNFICITADGTFFRTVSRQVKLSPNAWTTNKLKKFFSQKQTLYPVFWNLSMSGAKNLAEKKQLLYRNWESIFLREYAQRPLIQSTSVIETLTPFMGSVVEKKFCQWLNI